MADNLRKREKIINVKKKWLITRTNDEKRGKIDEYVLSMTVVAVIMMMTVSLLRKMMKQEKIK